MVVVSVLAVGGVTSKLSDDVVTVVDEVEVAIVSMRVKDVSTTASNGVCWWLDGDVEWFSSTDTDSVAAGEGNSSSMICCLTRRFSSISIEGRIVSLSSRASLPFSWSNRQLAPSLQT